MALTLDGTAGITFPNSTTQAVAGAPLTTPSFTTTIGVGAATASASGAGISFPATQSASSDANTLDDYEEGTFTPTFASQNGSITSYTGAGIYTKIGNIVYVQFSCTVNTVGTAGGLLQFGNLPFAGGTTSTNANQRPFIVRETAATGNIYFGYQAGAGVDGYISNSTNGAIAWGSSYIYAMTYTYQTT